MASGELFSVDPETGHADLIDLGGVVSKSFSLVLFRPNVINQQNNDYVHTRTKVALSSDLSCGTVVRNFTSDYYDFPATAVRKGNSLYYVNGKFGVAEEDVASTSYEIVRVDRDGGEDACVS
ncbi:unnamed protein product [Hapterophycus canaliculatus]